MTRIGEVSRVIMLAKEPVTAEQLSSQTGLKLDHLYTILYHLKQKHAIRMVKFGEHHLYEADDKAVLLNKCNHIACAPIPHNRRLKADFGPLMSVMDRILPC